MQHGELAEIDYVRAVIERLQRARHGEQSAVIDEAAARLNVSRATVYQRLRKFGWNSGRKLRSDRGDSRVTEDEVRAVAAIMRASHRANGKALLPVGDAMDIAHENGRLAERVSEATMLRLMQRFACHPAMLARPEPHVSMRSLHPNHVWQLDASICVLYYLRDGRVGVMDERTFNERKPAALAKVSNQRVMRYAMTDHTSGAVVARYYMAAGEDQDTLFEFLMYVMQRREDGVMHGVPFMLVWDAGSANMAHAIQALLTALAVRHWTHIPGNPRAKGQIECVHNVVERKFEGRLAFCRTDSVDELNAHLDTWLRGFNGGAIHSRHRHTRWAVWQTIRPEQLRLCPSIEVCRDLMWAKPQTRVVRGDLTIQFKVKGFDAGFYSVADVTSVRVGEAVTVMTNPYRAPNVFVVDTDAEGGTRYVECEPIARDQNGFAVLAPVYGENYASKPDTSADSARKQANEAAYGERDTLAAAAARKKGAVAFNGEIDPFADSRQKAAGVPAYMQRRGTELHVPNPVQIDLKPLSFTDALFALRARLGRSLVQGETAALQQQYPAGVPEDQLDAIVEQLLNPTTTTPEPVADRPRLAVVR